jgi:hypothetical protein
MIEFSLSLCPVHVRELLCLICGNCENDLTFPELIPGTSLYMHITALQTTRNHYINM